MPLQELKRKTTSSEFLGWCEFIRDDANKFHREDHYFAQLTFKMNQVLLAVMGYNPWKGEETYEKYLLEFEHGKREPVKEYVESEEDRKKRLAISRECWVAFANATNQPQGG